MVWHVELARDLLRSNPALTPMELYKRIHKAKGNRALPNASSCCTRYSTLRKQLGLPPFRVRKVALVPAQSSSTPISAHDAMREEMKKFYKKVGCMNATAFFTAEVQNFEKYNLYR